jgi:AcrR family transcriptional regulator
MRRRGTNAPTYGVAEAPPSGVRARTYRLLLDEAMALIGSGRVPSVAEVAVRSGVSRATAYRYFPSRGKLISAVIGAGLAPVRGTRTVASDGRVALRELFEKTFPLFHRNERQMRAALQLALEHEALERAGLLEEEPFRRGHRRDILRRAAAPLRERAGKAGFERLLKALSVIYGIEIYVVLKDIWGARDREVEAIARWMLEALVDAALREHAGMQKAARRRPSADGANKPRVSASSPSRAS